MKLFEIPPELTYDLFQYDVVGRPPQEACSALLEVSIGCSYSGCIFCEEEKHKRFRVNTLEQIYTKLDLLATIPGIHERPNLFLVGEDALHLPTDFLAALFRRVHQVLPNVERISMYARTKDVLKKGAADLQQLKDLGMGDLYIGLESGSDRILRWCRKAVDTATMKEGFDLLDKLGIPYSLSSIIGLGGRELCAEHAIHTARLYSSIHPKSIRIMTLTPYEGTTLGEMVKSGEFIELSPAEMLLEERLFLEHLHMTTNCLFIGNNVSNNVPLVGYLPRDREALIYHLEEALISRDPSEWQRREFDIM